MRKIDSILFAVTISLLACADKENQSYDVSNFTFDIRYHTDSTVKEITQTKKGLAWGKTFAFNKDGTKMWEFNYADDQQEGMQYYYQHGKLNFAVPYENGKQHGWARRYTGPCGSISEEGQYENGKMNGLWYNYYGAELLEIGLFKNDSLIKVVYRNKKYPDRNTPLPPIVVDCNEKWQSVDESR